MVKVSGTPGAAQVIGAFSSDDRARQAVERLRAAAVPDSAINVRRQAAATPPPPESPLLWRVFWSGLWWSVVGGVVGALLGLVIGLLGLGLPGTPDNLAVQIASWAMFLHVAGALAGCYAALDTGDRYARKADHHDVQLTLVRVAMSDSDMLVRAERILTEAGATDVELSGLAATGGRERAAGP